MSKTLLVARREYLDNLRTKTFWVGILMFPVLITIALVVARVLARSKDQRTYAVVDYSEGQWLSREIARRAMERDYRNLVRQQLENGGEKLGEKSAAELRAAVAAARARVGDGPVAKLLDVLERMPDDDLKKLLQAQDDRQAAAEVAMRYAAQFTAALENLDEKALRRAFAGLASGKYRQVPVEPPGDDLAALEAQLRAKVNQGDLFAYFVIGPDPVKSDDGSRYVSNNLTDNDLREWFSGLASEVVRERRVADLNLTKEQAQLLADPFDFREKTVSKTGAEAEVAKEDKVGRFAPMAFVYLLWIAVFSVAQMLLSNTIEEKSNRIIEVLLSSVSPHQLMTGKIMGIAATGLTMVASWVVFAFIGAKVFTASVNLDLDLLSVVGDPLYLTSFIAYFLSGYLIYAALLVAIGSVCNSLKESQNLQTPVMMILIVPLLAMTFVVQDPNGTVSRILTYIPLYTPFLMMNRAGGPPPAWEYAVTSVLIVGTIAAMFWAAGKVFRVGILMTGKPPRLREILGWLFHPPRDSASARS